MKGSSKRVAVVGVALLALLATGCGSEGGEDDGSTAQETSTAEEQDQDEGSADVALASCTIGATEPLSGEAAAIGEFTQQGAEMAAEDLRASETADLSFQWEDSQLDTQVAITALERLISNGIQVHLTGGSSVIVAQAPVAEREEVVMVNSMAQSPLLEGVSDWVFNALPTSSEELAQVAEIAVNDLGLETFGLLVVDNDLGVGDSEALTQEIEDRGGTVTITETYPVGATDMRTALTRIRSESPDGLYIIGNTDEMGYAISQTQELGMDSQLLGRTQSIDPTVLERAGDAANGMIGVGTAFRPAEDNEIGQNFQSEYEEQYGDSPSVYAAVAYDSTRLIGDAVAAAGSCDDPAAIRDHLSGISDFPGAMGEISIGDDNTATYPLFTWEVEDGEAVPYEGE